MIRGARTLPIQSIENQQVQQAVSKRQLEEEKKVEPEELTLAIQ